MLLCDFGEFQGLKRNKEDNLEGSYFYFFLGLVRGFLQFKEGNICFFYCSIMVMSGYSC